MTLVVKDKGNIFMGKQSALFDGLFGNTQKVATLVNQKQPAGSYKVEWDASGLNLGVYFCCLEKDNEFVHTRKIAALK